jgi:membrane protein YdbS with pleckstrin-like domain
MTADSMALVILAIIFNLAMQFINEQLPVENLPRIREVDFLPLEKQFLKVLWLGRMITAVIMIVVFSATIYFVPFNLPETLLWVSGTVIAVLLMLFLFFTPAVFRVKKYGIRSRDILYRSGLIFRSTVIVPFNRVQHIEIKTSPADRLFGLARLKIYTAGGSQSDLTIPGLRAETAGRIKELIITKTGLDEEE